MPRTSTKTVRLQKAPDDNRVRLAAAVVSAAVAPAQMQSDECTQRLELDPTQNSVSKTSSAGSLKDDLSTVGPVRNYHWQMQ